MANYEKHLAVAKETSLKVGEYLKHEYERLRDQGVDHLTIDTKNGPNDFVSEVDKQAQKLITDALISAFPNHRFIGEEGEVETLGDPNAEFVWIIDPLDGTNNFLRGKPNFGSLLALQHGDEFVLGIINQPILGNFIYGAKGLGVMVNDSPVKLRNTKNLTDANISMNITRQAVKEGDHLRVRLPKAGYILNMANAAEEIGNIIMGYDDAVAFDGVGLWDAAAGCALITEAGGVYRLELKEAETPYGGVKCVISTKEVFDELEAFLFA